MVNEDVKDSAWYSEQGRETDIVLSTRIRLARDLANFPFPVKFRGDDASHVRSAVFDAFNRVSNPEKYKVVISSSLDESGRRILCERGVIENSTPDSSDCGIVIRDDGAFSCIVNDIDHLRLSSFRAGFDGEGAFELCKQIDDELQNSLQFAASLDLGYLSAKIQDCGSGMKISFRLHLPAFSFLGKIGELESSLLEQNICIRDCFGLSSHRIGALGSFYEICTRNSGNGSEIDQMANIVGAVQKIAETERRFSEELFENRSTEIRDKIYKSYADAKLSLLVSFREAVESIGYLKWGLNIGILSGVEDSVITSLLYRLQAGHIRYVLRNRRFKFPKDVLESEELCENHIRSLLLQEAFAALKF